MSYIFFQEKWQFIGAIIAFAVRYDKKSCWWQAAFAAILGWMYLCVQAIVRKDQTLEKRLFWALCWSFLWMLPGLLFPQQSQIVPLFSLEMH